MKKMLLLIYILHLLSFINQKENPDIAPQLVNQLTIKTARFFSLASLQKTLLKDQIKAFEGKVELPLRADSK